MKKFIGIVGIGLICCLIFVILWRGKNPERNDVYGLMYQKLTPAFKENGYQVRALNLQDIQKSDGYNPIVYVRTMKEALMVADYMLGESKDIDVFFNEAEKQLLAACILYAAYQKPEYKNFFFVSKILLKGLSKEETSIFEFLIDTFSKVSDISIAEELSMTLKHFSERMLKILVPILCHKIMEIAEFVKTDDMDLERFADEKTIIFLITGPKESTYDFLVPLFIEQSFKEFVKQDNSATLKNHIYYVLDEFAQVRNIHNLEHMIATGKDYNISFLVSVMTIEQMEMLYPDYWLKIVNCFPNFVYMGSYDTMTIEYMKKLLEPTGIFDEVFLKETGKDNPKTRKEKMLYEHLAEKELYGTMDSTIIVTNRTYSFRKNITKPSKM